MRRNAGKNMYYVFILYFTFLFSLFVFVSTAGQYNVIWTGDWTASFSIRFRNGTCIIILDKKYNIANSSCHFGSYGSIWTGPSPKQYYMDRSIYCHMTLSAMNYLLYICTLMNFVRIGKVSKS